MALKTNILLETGTNELEIVEFTIDYNDLKKNPKTQSYGINVAKVREIIRLPEITEIPNMPDAIKGVFELRKKIIPAIDLSSYLYKQSNVNNNDKMIITEFNKIQTGLIVSNVSRIHRLSWDRIINPDIVQDFDPEKNSIVGILQMEQGQILMLDVEKIIADIEPNSAIDSGGKDIRFSKEVKVITAEDSAIVRKMIETRLKSAGMKQESFHNGLEAWQRLQEISKICSETQKPATEFVDVIISDIEMPKMDGYTLTKNIKTDDNLKHIPVILFSSMINKDLLHKGKSVGANAQLAKPQIGELLQTIRIILNLE
jgi:two-component system chemotaxis response regulator CheV